MAEWSRVEQEAPDLARRVRRRFAMGVNKTMATLRRDGSPRISAIEMEFADGQISFGMMAGSLKLLDVRRDPRVAIHSPTVAEPPDDPEGWPGDAKLAGTAVEVPAGPDSPPGSGAFQLDVSEVVLTYVADSEDHLIVESWHPGRGVRRVPRY